MTQTPNLPERWASSQQLDGIELVDKRELIGVPFRIFNLWFNTNEKGISFVYVEAENVDGTTFMFNDSSTGARQQIVELLERMGNVAAVDTGAHISLDLVVPRGMRVSEFDAEVIENNKKVIKKARTFYLTTSGKRPEDEPKKAVRGTRKTA